MIAEVFSAVSEKLNSEGQRAEDVQEPERDLSRKIQRQGKELSDKIEAQGKGLSAQIEEQGERIKAVERQGKELSDKIEAQGKGLSAQIEEQGERIKAVERQGKELSDKIEAQGKGLSAQIEERGHQIEEVKTQLNGLDMNVSTLNQVYDRQQTVIWTLVAVLTAAVFGSLALGMGILYSTYSPSRPAVTGAAAPTAVEASDLEESSALPSPEADSPQVPGDTMESSLKDSDAALQ